MRVPLDSFCFLTGFPLALNPAIRTTWQLLLLLALLLATIAIGTAWQPLLLLALLLATIVIGTARQPLLLLALLLATIAIGTARQPQLFYWVAAGNPCWLVKLGTVWKPLTLLLATLLSVP